MENKQKRYLLLGILLAGCVATSMLTDYFSSRQNAAPMPIAAPVTESKKQSGLIKIYVSGAVLEPGIYELEQGARAFQAVEAAGGLRADANLERVNLAKKLKDGMQVNVPALKGKTAKSTAAVSQSNAGENAVTLQNNQGRRIKLNTATAAELESLPGVGAAMAQRIIAQRRQQKFVSVDDLLRVKGIGKAKLAKLRPYVEAD